VITNTHPESDTLVPLPRAAGALLAAASLQPEQQLRAEVAVLAELRDLTERTYEEASRPDAEPQLRWLYLQLVEAVSKQTDRVQAAEERVRRALFERRTAEHWEQRRAELTAALEGQYGRLGPEYAVLIRRLVHAEIRAQQLEASGADITAGEWRRVGQEIRDTVQALRRAGREGEAGRAQRARDDAMMVLRELERVIAPVAPELWHRAISELRQHVQAVRGD
jgi:hypothetical protein